ncbi:MAG: 3-deoxy-manno-octulosonate cytidylyltransferase [Longimicrobiales bacterium]|nr:3-deoxy-manno-octulosonate cytidylyltransferase [Longimicrobiales bacterium]
MIPARLASSRLPRKPLYPLLGRPLIEWVWQRALTLEALDHRVVAADDLEVSRVCAAFGAEVVCTDPAHPSGTDRVAEVARRPEYAGFEIIVNLQGDEPLVSAEAVNAVLRLIGEGWGIATCAVPIEAPEDLLNPSVVKVVRDDVGGALYFSRAPIPAVRADATGRGEDRGDDRAEGAQPRHLRHLGLYAYRRTALEEWVALPEGRLERLERLEQLRPLAAGIPIGVAVVDFAAPGVDTPGDVAEVERRLRDHPVTHA